MKGVERPTRRRLCVVEAGWALGVALGSYVVANAFELVIVRWMKPSVPELVEASDLILAAAVGVTAYLWLHLRTTRTDLHRLEREQIVVSTQLAAAAEIQRRLLPSQPRTVNGIACAVGFESAWEIGGDFYDFLPIAHDAMLVVIGDISGKGIPAAILLAFVRTALRVAAARTTDPAELLTALSDALYEDNEGTPYATCLVSRVDTQRGTLTYANAGHPPGVIFGPQGVQVLDSGGPPVGMFESPAGERRRSGATAEGARDRLRRDHGLRARGRWAARYRRLVGRSHRPGFPVVGSIGVADLRGSAHLPHLMWAGLTSPARARTFSTAGR